MVADAARIKFFSAETAAELLEPSLWAPAPRSRFQTGGTPGPYLQPRLVHSAYLRYLGQTDRNWQNREHFFSVAAQVYVSC